MASTARQLNPGELGNTGLVNQAVVQPLINDVNALQTRMSTAESGMGAETSARIADVNSARTTIASQMSAADADLYGRTVGMIGQEEASRQAQYVALMAQIIALRTAASINPNVSLPQSALTRFAGSARIASIGGNGTVATVNTVGSHGFTTGDRVAITDTNFYNVADVTITVTSANQFTYASGVLTGTYVGGYARIKAIKASSTSLAVGQRVSVTSNDNLMHPTTVAAIPDSSTVVLTDPMPFSWIGIHGANVGAVVSTTAEEIALMRSAVPGSVTRAAPDVLAAVNGGVKHVSMYGDVTTDTDRNTTILQDMLSTPGRADVDRSVTIRRPVPAQSHTILNFAPDAVVRPHAFKAALTQVSNATSTTVTADDVSGLIATDRIGVELNSGAWHFSTVLSVDYDTKTVFMSNGIPNGQTAGIGKQLVFSFGGCFFSFSAAEHVVVNGGIFDGDRYNSAYGADTNARGRGVGAIIDGGSSNITFNGTVFKNFAGSDLSGNQFGDGSYINDATNINYNYCVFDGCARQGVSIIAGKNIGFNRCVFTNITGNFPGAGVDCEPNTTSQIVDGVTFTNCYFDKVHHGIHLLSRAVSPNSTTLTANASAGDIFVTVADITGITVYSLYDITLNDNTTDQRVVYDIQPGNKVYISDGIIPGLSGAANSGKSARIPARRIGNVKNVSVTGCYFGQMSNGVDASGAASNSGTAIRVSASIVKIWSNTFDMTNTVAGITCWVTGASFVKIHDNDFFGNQANTSQNDMVRILDCQRPQVYGNLFYRSVRAAVAVDQRRSNGAVEQTLSPYIHDNVCIECASLSATDKRIMACYMDANPASNVANFTAINNQSFDPRSTGNADYGLYITNADDVIANWRIENNTWRGVANPMNQKIAISRRLSAAASLNFGTTAPAVDTWGVFTANITVPGAAIGDPVDVGAPKRNTGSYFYFKPDGEVTAANTVTVELVTRPSATPVSPQTAGLNGTYKVVVTKHDS